MVRARHGAQLSRLVPELVGAYSASDHAQLAADGGDPFALYEAVVGWLTLVSDGGPVLLVLDDLQWASRPDARDAAAPRRHRAPVPGDVARDVPRRRRSRAPARPGCSDGSTRPARCSASRSAGLEPEDVVAMVTESQGATARRRARSTRWPRRSTRSRAGTRCSSRHSRASSSRTISRGCGGRTTPCVRPSG